jgi:ankyrin repeat protein
VFSFRTSLAVHRVSILRWLLEQGATPNPSSGLERTSPLAYAAEQADPAALHILLSYGAEDPEAIFHAIGVRGNERNGTATMEALIEHGADINYVSERWATPLCLAIRFGGEEKLRLLLKHGANPVIRSQCGRFNAYECAAEWNRQRFYDIMEETCRSAAP